MGLHRAGFDVTGVDIVPRPNYPFRFVQADALSPPFRLQDFDFIWASPPCQHASWGTVRWRNEGREYPALIEPTRDMLNASGVPYVIENVVGAAVRPDLVLTGEMFGLKVIRRRHFELGGWWYLGPVRPYVGKIQGGDFCTVAGHGGDAGAGRTSKVAWQSAMGIDWMTKEEMAQAIPPAYGEYIGRAFLAQQPSRAA
jgi:DNA (cytosine-5)-methyltransferase 1